MSDLRTELISRLERVIQTGAPDKDGMHPISAEAVLEVVKELSELSTNLAEVGTDLILRQAAIDALRTCYDTETITMDNGDEYINYGDAVGEIEQLPPAQPERRCVNCGRTVNNGGWYEDGRTRCPIEEHYALPKDGYCHLWEKRKDWEDDYVKRAEEGEK